MTRRQSNNLWSGGIAARPAPKIPSAKIRWKVLASIFWEQDGILLIDYLSKGQTINPECNSFLLMQMKDILKGQGRGNFTNFTKGFLFLHTMRGSPDICNPEETGLPSLPMS